jgi:serine O-acetyltransferase
MTPSSSQDTSYLWSSLLASSHQVSKEEPDLASFIHQAISSWPSYSEALSNLIIKNLNPSKSSQVSLEDLVKEALKGDPNIASQSLFDLQAIQQRDPACKSPVEAFLFYRGFKALQCYRVAHYFWSSQRHTLARYLQSVSVESFSMDIHPGARIAQGIFIDHGTGIVIGETAIIEKNVSILHNVTLGGTGKTSGARHPTIREGVMLGAGCKVLGNITVGKNSKVAAGSIVLQDVPDNTTAVGIPARIVERDKSEVPAYEMKQEV